ncbi:MAG: DNA alkylation repair protein [Paludibacteraceae bacterium]|nr:DNA alkylation repair protein [Paludibacteraceae bacterium]
MSDIETEIRAALMALQDVEYRAFHAKLVPGKSEDVIIGVRTPALRKLAKQYSKDDRIGEFLAVLPHKYYEETNMHGFIISELKDYGETVREIDRFLPFVDNWATCDLLSPKAFKQKKNRTALLADIRRWMASSEPYTVRFGIEILMSHYLDDDFSEEYLEWVARIDSDHYYVRMMVAWYFATALAKQYSATVPYIEKRQLPEWTHRKTIQKAIESFRVTPANKAYLRLYR